MSKKTSGKRLSLVSEDEIHAPTPKGRRELSGAGTSLSPLDLRVLVLIDGRSTAGSTVQRAHDLGIDREEALATLGRLFADGLIALVKNDGRAIEYIDFFSVEGTVTPEKARLADAKRAAAATEALLKDRGYYVSIARRPEAKAPANAGTRSVLVVEDEPLVVKLLKHVLEGEGFEVRTAMNRDEIAEQLRRHPLVDLVLLDVVLPDIDGFQILDRIRLHPTMKSTPVVMLTSKATREAVLRGLQSGANGYITKPFEIPVLIKALHAVLGMSEDGDVITSKDPWS
jgi:CheY-like chemotaxis protein